MSNPIKIAVVQEGPVFLDLTASMERALGFIARASDEGAQLVVFPETWLSGYPFWLDVSPAVATWDHEPAKEAFLALHRSGISVPGPETEALAMAAEKFNISIGIGVNETPGTGTGNGSIFNTFLLFDQEGKLRIHHRKLMPTHGERLVHAPGDGHGLASIPWQGGRLGGLICWEHWMPLTRQAMHEQGEHIHLGLWPQVKAQNHLASQHYALEGRCFVVAVGARMRYSDLPSGFPLPIPSANEGTKKGERENTSTRENTSAGGKANSHEEWILSGGSALYAPNGECIEGPLGPELDLAIWEIENLDLCTKERMSLDASGHYNRRDVFKFTVDRTRS